MLHTKYHPLHLVLLLVACVASNTEAADMTELPTAGALTIGMTAPDFAATDAQGTTVTRQAVAGRWAVFYFYPKDDTPGCTVEAKTYSSLVSDFAAVNAVVYGVSLQDAASHTEFRDKHDLRIPLLVDQDGRMAAAFGVNVRMGAFAARDTVVLDPSGKIARIDRGVDPGQHPPVLLDWLRAQAQIKK